jgi:putative addiction module component (TIGR02574 family)
MILERFPELLKLSEVERLQLCTELSGTLFSDEEVTDPVLIAELDRRMEEYRRDPSTGRPWSEVRKELREKYLQAPSE